MILLDYDDVDEADNEDNDQFDVKHTGKCAKAIMSKRENEINALGKFLGNELIPTYHSINPTHNAN